METDITSEGKIFMDTFISENLENLINLISQMGAVKVEVRYGQAQIFSPYRYLANIDCKNGCITLNRVIDNVYFEALLSIDTNCKGITCNRHMRQKCCFRYFVNKIKSIMHELRSNVRK